jgi:signal transduction histidine kinase
MQKARILSLIFCFIFLLCHSGFNQETKPDKNILILFSFTPSTPAYLIITDGIRTKLQEAFGDSYNLHLEYLESERYPESYYKKERFDIFNAKYQEVPLDLLVCVGINIIESVKQYASEKLITLPVITIDFDVSAYGVHFDLKLNDRTAVIGMKMDVKATLEEAFKLFPDRSNIYFIGGISNSDRLYMQLTRTAVNELDRDRKYNFITDMSMDEVLSQVRKLPDYSLVVVPGFNSDSKMVPYYNPESVRLIAHSANAPIICYSDIGFGEGAIGGYILSFKKIGVLAGEAAVKILNGADPNTISISKNEYYEYVYDWRQLKRWNLQHSNLIPRGSDILFEETSFFGKYKMLIFLAVFFIILQSMLIIQLVKSNRKKGQVTMQLIDIENKFRDLVKEDRILSMGQLTASLSHELNQPLTSILSMSQAGNRYLDADKPDMEMLKEIFQNIVESDRRAASILSSIRGMMKLEKKEKEKINLNTLIEELILIYQSEAIEKRVNLTVKLPHHPVFIMADQTQIQQVILNLVSNATHSIEKINGKNNTIIISEVIDVSDVIVSVRDYGEGIPESIKNKIFKPFITTKEEGTGIGLAISRTIIDDHQGKIWAENMPDGGAMFSFSLKILEDEY